MRILLSGLVAALLAVSTAGVAQAKSYVHDDGTGDVWFATNLESTSPVPDQVEGDITRVQLRHSKAYIQLFMSLRDIKRETRNTFFYFDLQTGKKKDTIVTVGTYPMAGKPDGVLTIRNAKRRAVTCRGTTGFAINWETNVVAVTFPRRCLGNPKLVRMQALDSLDYSTAADYSDDGLGPKDAFLSPRVWSPWVGRN